jgi:NitT/TauT family transport system permease protein
MPAKSHSFREIAPILVLLGGVFGIWEAVRIGFALPRIVLPIAGWAKSDYLLAQLAITVGEALAGFAVGSVLAFALACVFLGVPFFRRAVYPLALILKSTPLIALAPLIVIWLGSGTASKVAMSAILCFFPILVACYDGLRQTDPSIIDLLRLYGARPIQIIVKARIPAALPQIFSGLRVAVPLAVVGAVIGEYLSATRGIGYVIANASYHLETALVFASLFTISAASLTMFGIVVWAEKRLAFWRDTNSTHQP